LPYLVVVAIIIGALVAPVAYSQAQTNTTYTTANTTVTTTTGSQQNNPLSFLRLNNQANTGTSIAVYIIGIAVLAIFAMYLFWGPPSKGSKEEKTYTVKLSKPKSYDFIVYVVDEANGEIKKDKLIKVTENLYVSTDISNPTFYYTPPNVKKYLCKQGKTVVPWRYSV